MSTLNKKEGIQINNLTLPLKTLEKEQQTKPKESGIKEVIKIGVEISEKQNRKIKGTKSSLFDKINKIEKALARLTKRGKEKRFTSQASKMKQGALLWTLQR